MEFQTITGVWEDVVKEHSEELAGHSVQVRVVEELKKPSAEEMAAFDAAIARMHEITKNAPRLPEEAFRRASFYDSED